jgi:hypothetical protein
MQTDAQKLVVVRDQFALKGLSDDALKQILPAYKEAMERLQFLLRTMPPGNVERELWLRTQLATIEAQFRPVAERIYQVLPEAQARAFEEGLTNARKYLEAGGIQPEPAAATTTLSSTTIGGQQVSVTGNLPGFNLTSAVDKGFISPSITRQQIVAAARETGFSVLSPGGSTKGLADLLPNYTAALGKQVQDKLRAGFLLGLTNEEMERQVISVAGELGPGRRGRAMTEALVRTSMAEASQSAHDAFYEANEDLLLPTKSGYRWWWDASNDTRLCPVCAPLDGIKFKERDEPPHAWPAHFSCRCKLLPITATMELMEEEDGPASGSFLEATPVQYDRRGKRKPPPPGYTGDNAYKRPMKIDGKQQWVRRRDLGPGQTTAGDMLQNANEHSKRLVLGKHTEAFNKLTGKGGKYEKNPQGAVRELLGNGLPPGSTAPRPTRGPKPKPPAPKAPKTSKASDAPKAAPAVDVSQMRRAKPGGEYGPDGHWYPGGAFISDGKYQGNESSKVGIGDGILPNSKDDKGKNGATEPTVVRNRKTEEPRPMRPSAATGLARPENMKALLEKRDREFFTTDGFLVEDIEKAAKAAGAGRSPLDNTLFRTALSNRVSGNWLEEKIAAIRKVVKDVDNFDYYIQDARDQSAYEFDSLKRGATTATASEYASANALLQAVFELAGERIGRKKGGRRLRSVNEDVVWIMNNLLMVKRRA